MVLDQEPADETSRLLVADLHRSILCTDTPLVTWRTADPIGVDLRADLREKTVPFRLLEGRAYEMLLIARLKAFPNRDVFEQCMSSMGFRLEHAIALKKDMRVRGKPNASATLWYCVGTWGRSNSYIVDCDPFYFESVQERPTPKEEGT